MPDLLVKLYQMPESPKEENLLEKGVKIKRAFPGDRTDILAFIKENFSARWADECAYALGLEPPRVFLAVRERGIIGFACYDASAKNFFGPLGVKEEERRLGVGAALLHRCMRAMKEDGYAYAIIGWVGDALKFYQKQVGAVAIEDTPPEKSVYSNMVSI